MNDVTRISRRILASLPWIAGPVIFWSILLREIGFAFGLFVGIFYVVAASFAAERLPIDLYEARLVDIEEDPDLPPLLKELAEDAGIPPPTLYLVALDEPNMVIWASASGRSGFSRIGIPPGFTHIVTQDECRALLALAVARIASGEAAALSNGASLSGLALQAAYAKATNFTLGGALKQDPDTRMTPLGGVFFAALAPMAWASARLSMPAGSVEWSDAYAARMTAEPEVLASALEKLASYAPQPGTGALRGHNPGLTGLFATTPFEKLIAIDPATTPLTFTAKIARWIALAMPSTASRAERVRKVEVEPRPQAPDIPPDYFGHDPNEQR